MQLRQIPVQAFLTAFAGFQTLGNDTPFPCQILLSRAPSLFSHQLQGQSFSAFQVASYTNFFADALVAEAKQDKRIIGIHAAMGGGTGMNRFEQHFPDRTFDVGIAEQVGTQ